MGSCVDLGGGIEECLKCYDYLLDGLENKDFTHKRSSDVILLSNYLRTLYLEYNISIDIGDAFSFISHGGVHINRSVLVESIDRYKEKFPDYKKVELTEAVKNKLQLVKDIVNRYKEGVNMDKNEEIFGTDLYIVSISCQKIKFKINNNIFKVKEDFGSLSPKNYRRQMCEILRDNLIKVLKEHIDDELIVRFISMCISKIEELEEDGKGVYCSIKDLGYEFRVKKIPYRKDMLYFV